MTIDVAADRAQLAGKTISGSDWVTVDGDSGNLYLGRHETVVTQPEQELAEIASWSRTHVRGHEDRESKPRHHRPVQQRTDRDKRRANQ
jgi:pyruvate,orthophosphate dikinase